MAYHLKMYHSKMAPKLLALILLSGISARGQDIRLSKEHYDKRTGLAIRFPDTWRLDEWPVFAIVNFLPKQRPKQNIVPVGGAQIVVMAPRENIETISDWLRADHATSENGAHIVQVSVPTLHFGNVMTTVVEEKDYVIPKGQSVSYYFVLNGRLYKASLFYRGEKQSAYYKDVLQAVIKNLVSVKTSR